MKTRKIKRGIFISLYILCFASIFCAKNSSGNKKPVTWTIDVSDADQGNMWYITHDSVDWDNSACVCEKSFDALFLGTFPREGDSIELYVSGVSDIDIPNLVIQLADKSLAADGWMELSTVHPEIQDIKAGEPFSEKIIIPVETAPKGDFSVRFYYDASWKPYSIIGKSAEIITNRVTKSFDRKKQLSLIGIKDNSKVYNLDLCDSQLGDRLFFEWAEEEWSRLYRPQYGGMLCFREYIRGDLPKAGDYVIFHYNITSNVDLPRLVMQIADSTKESYDPDVVDNCMNEIYVKAGTPVKGKIVCKVLKTPKYSVDIKMYYDDSNTLPAQKVGKQAVIELGRVCESTQTLVERGQKSYDVDISKLAGNLTLTAVDSNLQPTTEPSKVAAYHAVIDVTSLFTYGDYPRRGDIINITYSGTFNINASYLIFSLYEDNSVSWWRELGNCSNAPLKRTPAVLDIKAGEKINIHHGIVLSGYMDSQMMLEFICVR